MPVNIALTSEGVLCFNITTAMLVLSFTQRVWVVESIML